FSQDKDGRVGKCVIRHEEKREHGRDALEAISAHEGDYQEEYADHRAEKQRDGWGSASINACRTPKKEPVTTHGIQCARAEELIGVETAQHGNHHDRPYDGIAKTSENAIGNGPKDKCVAGDFVHGHDVQRDEVQEQVNSHNGKDTAEDGARNIAAGIAHLLTEIDDAGRDIPRAIFGSVFSIMGIYLLLNLIALYIVPMNEIAGNTFVLGTVANRVFGSFGDPIIRSIMVISMLSCLNANQLFCTRTLYAMSCDGLFFRSATSVNTGGTPTVSLLLSTMVGVLFLVISFMGGDAFQRITAMLSFFFVA